MKNYLVGFFIALSLVMIALPLFAQTNPVPAPIQTVVTVPAQVVTASPIVPSGSVTVAEPAAPPEWAEKVMVALEKMPVIGPIVTKVIFYLGILVSLFTSLVAFLMSVAFTLSKLANMAGFIAFVEKLDAFNNGKFMYFVKSFTVRNPIKKPTA